MKIDNDKKPELRRKATRKKTKSISLVEGVLSQPSVVDSERNDETSERNSGLSPSSGSPTTKHVPELDAASRKARKRKIRFYVGGDYKKPRTDKNKCAANASPKRDSKVTSATPSQYSKPQRKCKQVKDGAFLSMLKSDTGAKKDTRLKDEVRTPFISTCIFFFSPTRLLKFKCFYLKHIFLYLGHNIYLS